MVVDTEKAYLEWAINEFLRENGKDFRRAESFDGIISRECVLALRRLPLEQRRILAYILPRGMKAEDPKAAAVKFNLNDAEEHALQSFMEAGGRMKREMWSEFSQRVRLTSKREFQLQFRSARQECNEIVEKISKVWKCQILRAGPGEWCLLGNRTWGEIKIAWHFKRDLELTYSIILDSPDVGGVRAGHYLGALGIGPSLWVMDDTSKCKEVFERAQEFVAWHVEECDKVMNDCIARLNTAREV